MAREPERRGSGPLQDVDLRAKLEKLAAARIQLLPVVLERYYAFEREGFIALVEKSTGMIGTPSLLAAEGPLVLVWRGGRAFFVGKGFERAATEQEMESSRSFSADLKSALR